MARMAVVKAPERVVGAIKEKLWLSEGLSETLRLARLAARRVPAYREILNKSGLTEKKGIAEIQDLQSLPIIDKDTYLRAYPLEKLCWDGVFSERQWTLYATSGSTGEPFYFPHTKAQDEQYALFAELYLRSNFHIHRKRTLYINGFPLGAWIGGVFTLKAITMVAERGRYPLTIINPGIHKEEIIKAVKKFGHEFDQIIIGSYGPFLKDVLDDGMSAGVDWKKYDLGFVFAAEGFSETFREHVLAIAGRENTFTATLNQYGTVDLGTMSFETPLSILIRRIAVERPEVHSSIFKDTAKLPTLTQYMPQLFYFEELQGSLICSAWSGIPLVRYDLKDNGGVHTFAEMNLRLKECGIDIYTKDRQAGVPVWEMPFVYVYERSDFSVSLYAFQVHPATVRRALESADFRNSITGKFTMLVKHTTKQNPYLEVNVEMRRSGRSSPVLISRIQKAVTEQLLQESSEFRETWKHKGTAIKPRIVCWTYGHDRYFRSGAKQKWSKR